MNDNVKVKYPKLEAKIAESGVSNTKLAEALGITPSMLSKRLNGSVEFDLGEVASLVKFFNCKFTDLFPTV